MKIIFLIFRYYFISYLPLNFIKTIFFPPPPYPPPLFPPFPPLSPPLLPPRSPDPNRDFQIAVDITGPQRLDRIPEDMLNKILKDISNKLLENIPYRMPEDLPDKTRKYVK